MFTESEKLQGVFSIETKKLHWINGDGDDPDDLCLHGDVVAQIGNEIFDVNCTVSATALYLLKSLEEDHFMQQGNQMLPCCGHDYVPNETNDAVIILGCPNGVDWSVLHQNNRIKLVSEKGIETCIDFEAYRTTVFEFADTIRAFYAQCGEKNMPKDVSSKNGYLAFWNEWNRRRAQ